MRLFFIGKTRSSDEGECEALYLTDRGTAVIQGKEVTDPEAIADARDFTDGEVLNEVPLDVLELYTNLDLATSAVWPT